MAQKLTGHLTASATKIQNQPVGRQKLAFDNEAFGHDLDGQLMGIHVRAAVISVKPVDSVAVAGVLIADTVFTDTVFTDTVITDIPDNVFTDTVFTDPVITDIPDTVFTDTVITDTVEAVGFEIGHIRVSHHCPDGAPSLHHAMTHGGKSSRSTKVEDHGTKSRYEITVRTHGGKHGGIATRRVLAVPPTPGKPCCLGSDKFHVVPESSPSSEHRPFDIDDDGSLTDLMGYLDGSPSPYHAVFNAQQLLIAAGFQQLNEQHAWPSTTGKWFAIRGGALVAWIAPEGDPKERGLHIVGAHTDSPNLRMKPKPDVVSAGWRQVGVEVYGGALSNSWLDRDLGVSGRVVLRTGEQRLVRIDRPIARVAQLAIHLERDVNEKGLILDKQLHMTPLTGLGFQREGSFASFIAESLGLVPLDIASWDLMFDDLSPARTIGIDNELLASGRIDNLFSCWAAIRALIDSANHSTSRIRVAALFDHEEIGSESTSGARGPFLETVLLRVLAGQQIVGVEDCARTFASSSCVSSDMAHSVHPNYADRHEPDHRPLPNLGPVIKINANQRYATDATTSAMFAAACERVGQTPQVFVSKNSQPCGSTIGPSTATRLGIATVDVGCAMLSMHSARELCGSLDARLMRKALGSYYSGE